MEISSNFWITLSSYWKFSFNGCKALMALDDNERKKTVVNRLSLRFLISGTDENLSNLEVDYRWNLDYCWLSSLNFWCIIFLTLVVQLLNLTKLLIIFELLWLCSCWFNFDLRISWCEGCKKFSIFLVLKSFVDGKLISASFNMIFIQGTTDVGSLNICRSDN